jgi:hypothetical protein
MIFPRRKDPDIREVKITSKQAEVLSAYIRGYFRICCSSQTYIPCIYPFMSIISEQ